MAIRLESTRNEIASPDCIGARNDSGEELNHILHSRIQVVQ